MLSIEDIEYMKNNRNEIKQLRTDPVTLIRKVETDKDPYTGESIVTEVPETVEAIVRGFTGVVGGEQLLIGGIAIRQGDVSMAFDSSVNLENITLVEHDGVEYTLFSVQGRGIGENNRYECIARRVK